MHLPTDVLLAKILVIVAVVCFIVAWLMSAGAVNGGNVAAWGYAGLAFLAGSFLP